MNQGPRQPVGHLSHCEPESCPSKLRLMAHDPDCGVVGKSGMFFGGGLEPCRVFHLLDALSCCNTVAVSSSHSDLMQECQESRDWDLNSVMQRRWMFLLTCRVTG